MAGASEGILHQPPKPSGGNRRGAVFLVSDQAHAITGQALNGDGGMAFG